MRHFVPCSDLLICTDSAERRVRFYFMDKVVSLPFNGCANGYCNYDSFKAITKNIVNARSFCGGTEHLKRRAEPEYYAPT